MLTQDKEIIGSGVCPTESMQNKEVNIYLDVATEAQCPIESTQEKSDINDSESTENKEVEAPLFVSTQDKVKHCSSTLFQSKDAEVSLSRSTLDNEAEAIACTSTKDETSVCLSESSQDMEVVAGLCPDQSAQNKDATFCHSKVTQDKAVDVRLSNSLQEREKEVCPSVSTQNKEAGVNQSLSKSTKLGLTDQTQKKHALWAECMVSYLSQLRNEKTAERLKCQFMKTVMDAVMNELNDD